MYPTVSQTKAILIKGKSFMIANLICDQERASVWSDGVVASFRLSLQDYHRYHSPVAGKVSWLQQVSGDYYQVDPLALAVMWMFLHEMHGAVSGSRQNLEWFSLLRIGATNVGTVE